MKIAVLVDLTDLTKLPEFIQKYSSFADAIYTYQPVPNCRKLGIKTVKLAQIKKYDWVINGIETIIPNIHLQEDARWFLEFASEDALRVHTLLLWGTEYHFPAIHHYYHPSRAGVWAIRPSYLSDDKMVFPKIKSQIINIPYALHDKRLKDMPHLSNKEKNKYKKYVSLPIWAKE